MPKTNDNHLTDKELGFLLETVQHQGQNLGQDQAKTDRFNRILKKDITVGDAIGIIETSVNTITMNMMRYMEGGMLTLMENTQVHHRALQELGISEEKLAEIATAVLEDNKKAEEEFRKQEAKLSLEPDGVVQDEARNVKATNTSEGMKLVENQNTVDLSIKTDK